MLGKIVSSRLENIEQEFLNSGGKWEQFEIKQLFEKIKVNSLPYSAQDLKGKYDEKYNLPALTAGVENQGLAYFVPREGSTILNNVISVSANGANTGVMFYQSKDFTVLQDSYAIKFIGKELNSLEYLYFLSALQKSIRFRYDWSNKAGWERIKHEFITVPVTNNEIDFSYMEKYIEELEALRIEELEAYLLATGLKDYKLTKYDENILDRFDKLNDNGLDRIRLEKILDWQVGIKEIDPLKLNLLYQDGEKYPFYGQATENNGIINYISLKKEVLNNKYSKPTILIHSNNQNIVYLETPFYLKDGHGATSVLQNKNMTHKSALYFMGAIKKVIKERFDYNSKATKVGLKNTIIELPVYDKVVDYKFMEDFITVVQKLVIKEVVLWADKRIEATRQVIER